MNRRQRLAVLTRNALPHLGLREVAETIAGHCRARKWQRAGTGKFANTTITEYEYDLARLRAAFYIGNRDVLSGRELSPIAVL